jgi:hypothetical protein
MSLRTLFRLSALATLAACADATTTAPVIAEAPSAARSAGSDVNRALAAARAATARYHRVAAAEADGYFAASPCVTHPDASVGAMGVHYVNPALIGDPALDPDRPEVLVYEPQRNGELRLVAVEYMKPKPMGPRPTLFGQTFEDGPNETYTLHAWVWQHNPSGMFAPFNPAASCANAPAPASADAASAHAHH